MKLDKSLHFLRFTRSTQEPDVYYRFTDTCKLIIKIYVNDLLITGTSEM